MLSTVYCRGAPVGSEAPGGRALGAPTSTGCSRGAEACRFGHVTRAARCLQCLLACERWQETPRSWSSMSAAAGVWAGSPGWAKLRAGLRARRPRGASMARRSTGACPEHALGLLYSLAKLSGKAYRARAGCLGRDGALNRTMTTSSRSGRRQRACAACCSTAGRSPPISTVSFTSLLSLQPPAGASAGRLASPALPYLPTPTTRASARRPRRPRRARMARRSSGECRGGVVEYRLPRSDRRRRGARPRSALLRGAVGFTIVS